MIPSGVWSGRSERPQEDTIKETDENLLSALYRVMSDRGLGDRASGTRSIRERIDFSDA